MYAQADLRLCWSHALHCWKSHVAAQIMARGLQGSIPGPNHLFLLIKDIVDTSQTFIRLFADDTSFNLIVVLNITALKLNSDLLKYQQWAKQ